MTKHADGNYYGTYYKYDNTGRVYAIQQDVPGTTTSRMTTQYTLDYNGKILATQDAVGMMALNTYDYLGRQTSSIMPENGNYSYTYDALNRLIAESVSGDGYQSQKYYYYDNAGHLIREKVSDSPNGASTVTYRETTYAYDGAGKLMDTAIWSDASTASYTHYGYDVSGRLMLVYTGMSEPFDYMMTEDDYQLTEYVYDTLGRMTGLIDPMGGRETYDYDANGNLITTVMRDGKVNRLTYNALGNVVTDNVYADATSTTPLSAKSYTYYPTGAVKSVTEDGTTTTYTYDERGNVLTETTGTTVNTYTYDHCNNRISHTLTVDSTVISAESCTYDQRGRLTSVSSAQGKTTLTGFSWFTLAYSMGMSAYGVYVSYCNYKGYTPVTEISFNNTQKELQKIANSVKTDVTGHVSGTKQHTKFAEKVNKLGNKNLRTEVSFLNGKEVSYGTKGSVRLDVVEYDANGKIIAVYDLKTGWAKLTETRIKQIQGHVGQVPVIELKPQ